MKNKNTVIKGVLLGIAAIVVLIAGFNDDSNLNLSGLLSSLGITSSETSQPEESQSDKEDELSKKIKDYFSDYFSNNENYVFETVSVFDWSSEGASITGYYDKNELVLLKTEIFGSLGREDYSYYIIDENTRFTIKRKYDYSGAIDDDSFSVTKESAKIYLTLNEKTYNFDVSTMKITEEISQEDFDKDLFSSSLEKLKAK